MNLANMATGGMPHSVASGCVVVARHSQGHRSMGSIELGVELPKCALAGDLGLAWIGEDGHEKRCRAPPTRFSDESP